MSPAIVAMMFMSGLIGETPTAKDADGKDVMLLAGVGGVAVMIENFTEDTKSTTDRPSAVPERRHQPLRHR